MAEAEMLPDDKVRGFPGDGDVTRCSWK